MNNLESIYNKAINSNIIFFDEYFYVEFYLKYEDTLLISDCEYIDYDKVTFKCRKLSYDVWSFLSQIEDLQDKEKMLLIFSLIKSNICNFEVENNIITYESIKNFLRLNGNIIKYLINKINDQYFDENNNSYRHEISKDFSRLYHSDKGVILEHKEIGDYLMLQAFWEKLGLNYFEVKKLPYDIYKQLSLMIGVETEVKNTITKENSNKGNKNNGFRRGK